MDSDGTSQKVRINVTALIDENVVGKFLLVMDSQQCVDQLVLKISRQLDKAAIDGMISRVLNQYQASIPTDELVGDVLRDSEDIFVILGGTEHGATLEHAEQTVDPEGQIANQKPPDSYGGIPGPMEVCEVDLEHLQQSRNNNESDWVVEDLTPKLREYIVSRFRESQVILPNGVRAEAAAVGGWITVLMRPKNTRVRTDITALPEQYNIARIDVVEFDKLCQRHVHVTREQLRYLEKCHMQLKSVLDSGASESDVVDVVLPFTVKNNTRDRGSVEEEMPILNTVEGFRPVIVVDTGGSMAMHMPYLKASMKRLLYSFLVQKSKFNLIRFQRNSAARAWAQDCVPPGSNILREAEEWIDELIANPNHGNMLDALRLAMSFADVDCVYYVCSGAQPGLDDRILRKAVRSLNIREAAIHVIGVDVGGPDELLLRQIAAESHGQFRNKNMAPPVPVEREPRSIAHDQRLSVGGQLSIVEVMIEEERRKEVMWLEESKCANCLLLASATQGPVGEQQVDRPLPFELQHQNHVYSADRGLGDLFEDTGNGMCASQLDQSIMTDKHKWSTGRLSASDITEPPYPGGNRRSVPDNQAAWRRHSPASQSTYQNQHVRPSVCNPCGVPGGVVNVSRMAAASRDFANLKRGQSPSNSMRVRSSSPAVYG